MGALDTAVRQGKALYAGISSYSAEQTREAAAILRELGTPLLIHQPSYSLLNRWIEPDLLDALGELGVGCITFSPLAQGVLTDRYLDGIPEGSRASRDDSLAPETITEETLAKVAALDAIAAGRGQSLAQMALAWTLRDQRVTSTLSARAASPSSSRTSARSTGSSSRARSSTRSTATRRTAPSTCGRRRATSRVAERGSTVTMEYRRLGSSDLDVSEIALGSWLTFGGGVDRERAAACVDRAFELGINFIDTANVYGRGAAEEFLGEAARPAGRATRTCSRRSSTSRWATAIAGSRGQVMKQIDASLGGCGPTTSTSTSATATTPTRRSRRRWRRLTEVVRAGKARYIGFSEWTAAQIQAAHEMPGVEQFVSSQPQYSLLWRRPSGR